MSKHQKNLYEDVRSTAYSFTIVGVLGVVFMLLIDLGIIPINMATYMLIIMNIVMGFLFLFFVCVGIKSFLDMKNVKETEIKEENMESEITTWFLKEHKDEMLTFQTDVTLPEEAFYPRAEHMKEIFANQYPDMDQEDLDYYIDLLYGMIFEE